MDTAMGEAKQVVVSLLLMFALAACSTFGGLRDENRANLRKIENGMTRAQVVGLMGNKTASGLGDSISNPYQREIFVDRLGVEYEILYYYTDRIEAKTWQAGTTPVVLREGRVAGTGWSFLEKSGLRGTARRG